MVNTATISISQAKKEAGLYLKVQKFWIRSFGKPGAAAIINGLQFTPFTASRHLTLNGASVARYLEWQGDRKAEPLRGKGIMESKELQ